MRLPNGQHAVVPIEKLVEYVLSPDHPRGKHKARVFLRVFGFTAAHADLRSIWLIPAGGLEPVLVTCFVL